MALNTKVKEVEEKIIEALEQKKIKIRKIDFYKLRNKIYLFNIISKDSRLGELKLHKSTIKQIANSKSGYLLIEYLINEIDWSA